MQNITSFTPPFFIEQLGGNGWQVLRRVAQNFDTVSPFINGEVQPCFKPQVFGIISAGRTFCKTMNIPVRWYLHLAAVEGLVSSSNPES
jgi:hypothetical protein